MRIEQIEERVELSDIIDYAMRDWDNYIDECLEEEIPPIDTFEEWIADAVLGNGYRKQREGEWKYPAYAPFGGIYEMKRCSICGYKPDRDIDNPYTKFCPNCGAKMKGANDENRKTDLP